MGRPRKPTALKILDGDRKDRIGGAEPVAPPGLGDPPTWLDRHARELWGRLEELHKAPGLVTRLDSFAAELLCQSYSTYRHALERISRELAAEPEAGPDAGWAKPHPWFKVANESHRQMARLLSKFGMTPSDRAGLHVREAPEEDAFIKFISRRKVGPDGKRSG